MFRITRYEAPAEIFFWGVRTCNLDKHSQPDMSCSMEGRVPDEVGTKAPTKLSAEADRMAPNEVPMPEANQAASTARLQSEADETVSSAKLQPEADDVLSRNFPSC